MTLQKILNDVESLACKDGELNEETTLLSLLDYLALAGLPDASACYVREMTLAHPGAKISPPVPPGVGSEKGSNGTCAADLLEQ